MIGPWGGGGGEGVGHLPQTEGRRIESHLVSSREEFGEGVDAWRRHMDRIQMVVISVLIEIVGLNAAEI